MDKVLQQVQALAEEQHSMVNIEQMMDCGASRKWIERRAEAGLILRDGPSVFRMPGVRRTFSSRAMGAVLSSRAPVLVSHRSAAYLHGFERIDEPVSVEIPVPRHRRPRARMGVRVHESLAFQLAQPTARYGIPVTGAARTILDIAPAVDKPIRPLDDALRQRIVNWDELWDRYLPHNVTGRNITPFRNILLERDGNTPPGGEFARRMADMLTSAGVPIPVFERRVFVGGHEYYLDLAWPNRMVAVECNDAGSHNTPHAFRRDPMKRNRCEGPGWIYLEFTGGTWSMSRQRCSPKWLLPSKAGPDPTPAFIFATRPSKMNAGARRRPLTRRTCVLFRHPPVEKERRSAVGRRAGRP